MNLAGPRFKYIAVRHLLVGLEQSPIALARLLWSRARSFMDTRPASGISAIVPFAVLKATRVGVLLLCVIAAQVRIWAALGGRTVMLNHPANLALRTHDGGVKYFDFGNGRVIAELSDRWSSLRRQEYIDKRLAVSRIELAPLVLATDPHGRYLVEQYVSAPPLSSVGRSGNFLWAVLQEALVDLMCAQEPQLRDIGEYVVERHRIIRDRATILGEQGLPASDISEIVSFAATTLENLGGGPVSKVPVIVSHGDLHEHNILLDGERRVLIDWESYTYASITTDLWHVLFRHHMERAWTPTRVLESWDEVLARLTTRVREHDVARGTKWAAINDAAALIKRERELFRHIFYLDLIARLLVQKPVDSPQRALTSVRRIAHWVSTFRRFDDALQRSPSAKLLDRGA